MEQTGGNEKMELFKSQVKNINLIHEKEGKMSMNMVIIRLSNC